MITAMRRPLTRPKATSHARCPETATCQALRATRAPDTAIDSVIYKVAETRAEREAAFRLVYDAYTASGLIAENPFRMRVTPYHLSPKTGVFLAVSNSELMYTVSLIEDAELGLPLEGLYGDAVQAMREQGHKLAEVSCLAGRVDTFDRKRHFDISVNLMGLMAQYARRNGVDRLLVAVHPRHAKFYVHFYGFQTFGELRSYDTVNGNPAVGCVHDFAERDRTGYPLRAQVYGVQYPLWELDTQPMSRAETGFFALAAEFAGHSCVPAAA